MKKNKTLIIIMLIFIIILLSFFISTIFSIMNMGKSTIFTGITINNIEVSGMTKEEATSMLENLINKKIEKTIKIKYNDNYESSLYYSVLNINYDISKAVNEAYNLGRTGNIIENNYTILRALLTKQNINIDISLDDNSLELAISDISSNLPDKMIQTSYYIEDENLIITKGSSGTTVKKDEFKNLLTNVLNDISSTENQIILPVESIVPDSIDIDKIHSDIYKEAKDAYYEQSPFKVYTEIIGIDFDIDSAKSQISENPDQKEYTIKLEYTYPKITLENLNINIFPDLLASFSTRYDAKNTSRSINLQLAVNKINGQIVAPGKEFSYNKIVGERTIEAGYKEAKVYSNGQVVDGIGGGICQISSTLYNAIVFANLNVTERYNHQFLTSYVSAGRDATVSYGSKDLKFINNRNYPIKIIASVNSGVAKIDIYGIKEDTEYDVTFDVETVSTLNHNIKYEEDSTLLEGTENVKQQGVDGIIVNTYKVLKKNGIIISKELISKDTYNSMDRIILKGTLKE